MLIKGNIYIYGLDTGAKEYTVFIKSRALGCSAPSAERVLLIARGFINILDITNGPRVYKYSVHY